MALIADSVVAMLVIIMTEFEGGKGDARAVGGEMERVQRLWSDRRRSSRLRLVCNRRECSW